MDSNFSTYYPHVALQALVGSRAYGLDREGSDTDLRGCYLPPTTHFWKVTSAPPAQIEDKASDQCYWELGKFLSLVLASSPQALETLYSPDIRGITAPCVQPLLNHRASFLSQRLATTHRGYARSQFLSFCKSVETGAKISWKSAMHALRLLIQGTHALTEGEIRPKVPSDLQVALLAVRTGELHVPQVSDWYSELEEKFSRAEARTGLPKKPDYALADTLLSCARGVALDR